MHRANEKMNLRRYKIKLVTSLILIFGGVMVSGFFGYEFTDAVREKLAVDCAEGLHLFYCENLGDIFFVQAGNLDRSYSYSGPNGFLEISIAGRSSVPTAVWVHPNAPSQLLKDRFKLFNCDDPFEAELSR